MGAAVDLIQTIKDICTVGAQKHGARMTVPVMCDACDERPATETHDFDGFAPPIHLCEPCADRWRDRSLEC